jgi:hypothetical protein
MERYEMLEILQKYKEQRLQFMQQRDLAQSNLNQLIGAIYACDIMIKIHEDQVAKQESQGDEGNGETESKQEEQIA